MGIEERDRSRVHGVIGLLLPLTWYFHILIIDGFAPYHYGALVRSERLNIGILLYLWTLSAPPLLVREPFNIDTSKFSDPVLSLNFQNRTVLVVLCNTGWRVNENDECGKKKKAENSFFNYLHFLILVPSNHWSLEDGTWRLDLARVYIFKHMVWKYAVSENR